MRSGFQKTDGMFGRISENLELQDGGLLATRTRAFGARLGKVVMSSTSKGDVGRVRRDGRWSWSSWAGRGRGGSVMHGPVGVRIYLLGMYPMYS